MSQNPFLSRVGFNYTGATQNLPVYVDNIPGISVELAGNLRKLDVTNEAKALWEKMQPVALDALLTALETQISHIASFQHVLARTTNELPQALSTSSPFNINQSNFNLFDDGQFDLDQFAGLESPVATITAQATAADTALTLQVVSLYSEVPFDVLVDLEVSSSDLVVKLIESITIRPGYNAITVDYAHALTAALTTLEVRLLLGESQVLTLRELALTCSNSPYLFADTPEHSYLHLKAFMSADFSAIASRYADRLMWAYAYQCAHLLMDEKLSSNRLNVFTNTNRDDTEDRREQYKTEFEQRLTTASQLILRDMTASGSPFFATDDDVQPGYRRGSYV